ncbi:MAG: PKD domain-containing protein, partial [Crocinitomicaceae bacterium]|nr:PKD domain-containing protein [Crocinitomicaceae bacterium]
GIIQDITGFIATGTDFLPPMTLINPTTTTQVIKYSIIPKSNNCDGAAFEYSITVKPKPILTIAPITKSTICGGDKVIVPVFSSSVIGSDYSWNLTQPNPFPSTITGISSNHSGTGQMPELTINNNGSAPVIFTYSINAKMDECISIPKTFSFTINPAPSISEPFSSKQEICSESSTVEVPFSSLTNNVKYVWKMNSIPSGLVIDAPYKTADSTLNSETSFKVPVFKIKNTTIDPLSIVIVVKAATMGAASCPGAIKTHTITINPKPSVASSTVSQLICNAQNTTAINFSSTTNTNMSYNWVNSNTSIGLAASGSGNIASFATTNSTKDVKVATITVTPIYSTTNKTCNGVPSDVIIKVLPTPEVNSITSQVKCPGENTDEVIPILNPASGSTLSWVLTGDKPNATSVLSGTGVISSVLAENTGSTIKTGTYKVTPTFTFEAISNQEKCSNGKNDLVTFSTSPATDVVVTWQNDLNNGIPASGTGNIASLTVTNATIAPITSNFIAKPSFTNSGKTCIGDDKTFSIKVNPIPTVNPVADITICPEFNQSAIPFSSPVSGTTYAWVSIGDIVGLSGNSGNGNIAAFTSVNTTDLIKTANIQITPTANSCPGPAINFKINVKPKPRITNTPLSQEICSGDKNTSVVWSSSVNTPTPTYSWTSSPLSSGLTIEPSSGTGNIPQDAYQFVNTGTSPISVKFTVIATVAACESTPADYTLIINPRPVLTDVVSQVICSGSPFTTPTLLSNILANTTFTWAVKTPPPISSKLKGYTPSGSGNLLGKIITNEDNIPLDLTYVITPKAYNCSGAPKEFSITINPTPQVNFSVNNQTICNKSISDLVTVTPQPSNATVSWSATIPSSISGFTTTQGTTTIPSYQLTNTSQLPDSITIAANASTVGTICPGITKYYKISVLPTPIVNSINDVTVCDTNTVSAIIFSGVSTSYEWTNSSILTGLLNSFGTGNISKFKANNVSTSPLISDISVKPKFSLNDRVCEGTPKTFKITVNPRPVLESLLPVLVCNNELVPEQSIKSNIASATYEWTNSNVNIGLAANGITKIPAFTSTNTLKNIITGGITVTPYFTNNGLKCSGNAVLVNYKVKPIAKIINTDTKDTICSGEDSKIIEWDTDNTPKSAVSYEWKLINNPDSITGFDAIGVGNLKSFKLYNKAKTIRSLVYRVKPTFSSCLGDTNFIYTLYVNPSPGLNGIEDQVICGGSSTKESKFSSDVNGTVFSWVLSNKAQVPSSVSGYIGATVVSGTGNIPPTVITNAGNNPFDLLYNISTNTATGCGGASQQLKITVNPSPTLDPVSRQTICSGQSTSLINLNSSTSNVSFIWNVVSGTENLSGVTVNAGSSPQIPVYTLSHNQLTQQTLKIVAYSKTDGTAVCDGKKDTIYISINPIPKVSSIPDQVLCLSENSAQVDFAGNGTTYNWISSDPTIGLASNKGLFISKFSAKNSSTLPKTAIISIIPEYNKVAICKGDTVKFKITVNPKPKVTALQNLVVCHNDSIMIKNFESTTPTTTFKWFNSNTNIGLSANGNGSIAPFKSINNSTSISSTSLVKVVPFIANLGKECKGDTLPFTLKINPIPTITKPNDIALCNDSLTKPIAFLGTGTSYEWFNSNPSIGLAANGTGTINTFQSKNNTNLTEIALIKIVPVFTEDLRICKGDTVQFNFTIHPTPLLTVPVFDTVCYNQSSKQVLFSSNLPGATFEWKNLTPLINSGLALSGTNPINTFIATNTSNTIETSIAEVITKSNACPSKPSLYKITVNPKARVLNLVASQDVCSGALSKSVVFKSSLSVTPTNYEWRLKSNPMKATISKEIGTGNLPSLTIVNDSSSIAEVKFNVIPSYNSCTGDTFVYTIRVLPRPKGAIVAPQIICGGSTYISPNLSSDVSNTSFSWKLRDSLLVPATIKGYLKSGVASLPARIIENTGIAPYTLNYDISTNGSGCAGQTIEFKLTINPAPKVDFSIPNQTICNNETSKEILISSKSPDSFFEWKVNPLPDSLTGLAKISGGSIIEPFLLINTSVKPIDILFSARGYTNAGTVACYGKDSIYKITVLPLSKVKFLVDQQICHGSKSDAVMIKGTATSYPWLTNSTGFGLSKLSGVNTIPSFTGLQPDTSITRKIQFIIQPKYTHQGLTCDGVVDTLNMALLPKPIIEVASSIICKGKKATMTAFGAAFQSNYDWSPNNGLSCTSCNPTIAQPITTTNYTIIGTNRFGCKDTTTAQVFVNPLPNVDAGPDTTLCNQPISHTMLGKVAGVVTSGEWTGSPDLTINGIYTPTLNGVYKVVYRYVLPTGCENFDTTIVTVKDVTKSNAGPDLIACFNDPDIILNGLPKPGTWTGFNVTSDGIFKNNKDTTIQLVYTIGKGTCLNRDTMSIKVHPDFPINAGSDKEFCFSDDPYDFTTQNYEPSTPKIKGNWTGKGIVDPLNGTFKPDVAGVGKHTIIFSYTHPVTGCVKYDSLIAEVHPLPVMKFKVDSIICLNTTYTILNQTNFLDKSEWKISPFTKYNVKNPTHKFDSVGFFDIQLIATSPFGCIDSLSKTIEVREAPSARFTRTPDSTCGPVSFKNLSTGIDPTFKWNFGDGSSSTLKDPLDFIYKPGIIQDTTYTISLIVQNYCGIDSMKLPIVVKPKPLAIFHTNVYSGCSPLVLDFYNTTKGLAKTYFWGFGNGTSMIKDSLFNHTFLTDSVVKNYTIKMIAYNECGIDSTSKTIEVKPNTVNAFFNADKIEGCNDLEIKFTQNSIGATFHSWDFGDGSTSLEKSPSHIYTKPGKYTSSLYITNGCSVDTSRVNISVYKSPVFSFSVVEDSLCIDNKFTFNSSTKDTLSYLWDFGDGNFSNFDNVDYHFKNSGNQTVTLTTTNLFNNCKSSISKKVFVHSKPGTDFKADVIEGCIPLTINFKNNTIDGKFYDWYFGDGSSSNQKDVSHVYTASGFMNVQ